MSVLLAHTSLGVQGRPTETHDAQGYPVLGAAGPLRGPWPGRLRQRPDGSWSIALDPLAWPVQDQDVVVEPSTGREWLVVEADILRNTADPDVDYVRVSGHERTPAGTLPAGGTDDRGL